MQEVLSKLAKLKALLDAGTITQEEFNREKARLLAGAPQQRSVPSAPTPTRRSVLKAPWLWTVIAAAIVVAVVLVLLFRPWVSFAPASASVMMDDFTQDQSLSSGLWVVKGPVVRALNSAPGFGQMPLVTPVAIFSATNGLEMTGAVRPNELASIESVASFDVPLLIKAVVMPSGGAMFGLALCDAAGNKGVAVAGRMDSADGQGEIQYLTPGPASRRNSRGTLVNSLEPNTWYTLSMFLDGQGNALLKVLNGADIVGQTNVRIGGGPFYAVLLQNGSGEPGTAQGHTHWRSVEILSGAGILPPRANSAANTGSHFQPTGSGLPAIQDPTVADGQTSLSLPPGRSIYLYGMATGGGAPSTPFSTGPHAQVSDAAGQLAAALAVTPENANSFTTETGYHTMGGVTVSGFSHYSASYGSNGISGAPMASDTFTVSRDSLVVVIGLAASQQSIRFTGIPGLRTDAPSSTQRTSDGVAIAHAYLPSGAYTVTEHSAATAGGQDPNHMADLIGVFAFY